MSLQETDPALASTKRWVFLLSRSWGSAPDPEVCLKGCRGYGRRDPNHTPKPPCTLASRLPLPAHAQAQKKKPSTTNWELRHTQPVVDGVTKGFMVPDSNLGYTTESGHCFSRNSHRRFSAAASNSAHFRRAVTGSSHILSVQTRVDGFALALGFAFVVITEYLRLDSFPAQHAHQSGNHRLPSSCP